MTKTQLMNTSEAIDSALVMQTTELWVALAITMT